MGTWSEGIFGNDTACDVRDDYFERLDAGHTPAKALKGVVQEFAELLDDDESWIVWISLAAAQLARGEVTKSVGQKALKGIEWCDDPDNFESSPFGRNALSTLRKKLGGPPPKPKKAKKSVERLGEKGDVLAVRRPGKTSELVIIVTGDATGRGSEYARVVLLRDVEAKGLTDKSLKKALLNWLHYRVPTPTTGPHAKQLLEARGKYGRSFGIYDVNGKLSSRIARVLFNGVDMPKSFTERLPDLAPIYTSKELPHIIEHARWEWKNRKWVVDPSKNPK